MLKNYVSEVEEIREYSIEFTYPDGNSGFSFPCDNHGELLQEYKNYTWCMDHPELFGEFNEFHVRVRYIRRKHGTCSCGHEVDLWDQYYGACQCEQCGKWYNLFGQELLPPDQWEEDPSEEEYW